MWKFMGAEEKVSWRPVLGTPTSGEGMAYHAQNRTVARFQDPKWQEAGHPGCQRLGKGVLVSEEGLWR